MSALPDDFIPPTQSSYGPFNWDPSSPMSWAQYRQNRNIFAFAFRGEVLPGPGETEHDPALLRRLETAWFAWELVKRVTQPASAPGWVLSTGKYVQDHVTHSVFSNRVIMPEVPGSGPPEICGDGHYGLHERCWLPQWHEEGHWHWAFIPLAGGVNMARDDMRQAWYFRLHTDVVHDLGWYRLSWAHCIQTGHGLWRVCPILQQAVRSSARDVYCAFIQTWALRRTKFAAHWHSCMPRVATLKIERLVQFLCTESATKVELTDALAEYQRALLEIRGWVRYCLALGPDIPSLDDVRPEDVPSLSNWLVDGRTGYQRGVFTSDAHTAQVYAQFNIPVWLVLGPDSSSYSLRLDDTQLASCAITQHASKPPFNSAGWSYVDQHPRADFPSQNVVYSVLPDMSFASGLGGLAVERTTDPLVSDPRADSPLLQPGLATAPPQWFPLVLYVAYAADIAVEVGRTRQEQLQSPTTSLSIPTSLFGVQSQYCIPPISIFAGICLRADCMKDHVLPRHITTWLQIRSLRLHQLTSLSPFRTSAFSAQTWRSILRCMVPDKEANSLIMQLGLPDLTCDQVAQQWRFRRVVDSLSNTLLFDGYTIPAFGNHLMSDEWYRFVLWELAELDFRSELLGLDVLIHECHPELRANSRYSRANRYHMVTQCWGGGGICPGSQSNLLCASGATRLDGLVAFAELMRAWPRTAQYLTPWEAYATSSAWENPPEFGSVAFRVLEESVWRCYTQTYFDYRHRHAPIPFMRPTSPVNGQTV